MTTGVVVFVSALVCDSGFSGDLVSSSLVGWASLIFDLMTEGSEVGFDTIFCATTTPDPSLLFVLNPEAVTGLTFFSALRA